MKRISCSAVLVIIYTVLYGTPRRPEKRTEYYIGTYKQTNAEKNSSKPFRSSSVVFLNNCAQLTERKTIIVVKRAAPNKTLEITE